jgi:hypothetical protein
MTVLSGYRLYPGLTTPTNVTETYAIENWTRQSDMETWRRWLRPDNLADVIEQASELIDGLSGMRKGYGDVTFNWRLRGHTPLMTKYVIDTYFAGGDYSADVTARTYNRATGQFEFYQARIVRTLFRDMEAALGGYDNMLLSFSRGIQQIVVEPGIAELTLIAVAPTVVIA